MFVVAQFERAQAQRTCAARITIPAAGGLSPLTPCGQRAACSSVGWMIPSWARCPQGLETARKRQRS